MIREVFCFFVVFGGVFFVVWLIKGFFFFFFRFLWFCFLVVEIHCKQVEWDPSREALDRSHWIDDRERRGCWFASILVVEINALSDIEERERESSSRTSSKRNS